MDNPWLKISCSDYESHMRDVGQTEVLNKLTKYCLDKYKPASFAILGCTTGNGLEHINPKITSRVYAIDINPEFIEKTREKFANKINGLKTYNLDIGKDELQFKNVDLFFIGLVLEYVEPHKSLKKIIHSLGRKGVLMIIIQENIQTTIVTKTKYKSLEKLEGISNEVNEIEINEFILSENMKLIHRRKIELTKNKSFIVLEYQIKEK
ncbi:MAG: class I SAM-dependent methyltransferase [Bacteroidales bacterium]|nr:class I SAM-dependent methyltransferase [Bacteroidales bacterium]